MDTSLAWLYEQEDEYRQRTGRSLWSISDWHNDLGDIVLPVSMLEALRVDSNAMTRYRFLDSVTNTKKTISSFYRGYFHVEFGA